MWRGAISFGMVAIPVRMYLATESKSVSFRMLCPSCLHPIKQRRWCTNEDREVGWTEVVRGFEVGKDEYVPVSDEDLDRLPLPTTSVIEICEFVDDSEIGAVHLRSPYYLEPEAVGAKPYALLRQALERTGRVAVAKLALRDREHLCRVASHGNGLLLTTLHWPDEIRDHGELKLPGEDVAIADRELDMAVMLVENLAGSFDPGRYRDAYRDALLAVVEEKRQGLEPTVIPVAAPAKVMDLMEALKASVDEARRRREDSEQTPAAEEPAAPARRRSSRAAEASAESTGTAVAARRRKAS